MARLFRGSAEKHSEIWKDEVILGLLRLRYRSMLEQCRAQVLSALKAERPTGVALVASLSRIDPPTSVSWTSKYLAGALIGNRNPGSPAALLTAILYAYVEVEESLMIELVARTSAIDADAGKRLSLSLRELMTKPWVRDKLGAKAIDRLIPVL